MTFRLFERFSAFLIYVGVGVVVEDVKLDHEEKGGEGQLLFSNAQEHF